jgi:prephenate dehydrogenase
MLADPERRELEVLQEADRVIISLPPLALDVVIPQNFRKTGPDVLVLEITKD